MSLLDHGTTNVDEYVTTTKDPSNARFPELYLDYSIECVASDETISQGEVCSPGHYYNWYPAAVPVLASPIVLGLRQGVQILSPLLVNVVGAHSAPVPQAFVGGDFIKSR